MLFNRNIIFILTIFIVKVYCESFPFKDTDGNNVNDTDEYFIMDCPTCNCLGSVLYSSGRYIKLKTCDKEDYDQRWILEKVSGGVSIKNFRGYIKSSTTNLGGWSYILKLNEEITTYNNQNSDGYVQFYTRFGGPFGYEVDGGDYFLIGKKANCGVGCIEFHKNLPFIFKKIQ